METIRVTIKPDHFRRALVFWGADCPLKIALKDEGHKVIWVRTGTANIEQKGKNVMYNIPIDQWGGYRCPYPPGFIDKLCQRAKESISSIPTVELQLTRY
jgi:hypothetical protein